MIRSPLSPLYGRRTSFRRATVPGQSASSGGRGIGLAGFVAGWLVCTAAWAGEPAGEGHVQNPPGRPVQVEVSVELVEVSQIDDRDQKFEVEFYVYYTWHDPRFVFDAKQAGVRRKLISAEDLWNPDPELLDELDVDVRGGKVVHAYPDGKLCFSRYYHGTIGSSLDLHEFPLDEHLLTIDLEESVFEADQVVFVPGEIKSLDPERTVPHGWKLANMKSQAKTSTYARTGEQYSLLRIELAVERDPHYYFWAIVLPLIPIVATAWSVFWMSPKEFGSQVSVGITAMLTIVAYRISIDSSLPPLNYMTRMDFFLLACQIFVFVSFIVVVAIHVLHVLDTPETQMMVGRLIAACRWVPPILLAATSVLLTLLPARFGHWILLASAVTVLVCYPPRPAQLRLLWQLITRPEELAQAEAGLPPAAALAGPSAIEPRRRAS